MRIVIVAWAGRGGATAFEAAVPLDFVSARNARLGYGNDFDLVFLEGLGHLQAAYLDTLRGRGLRIVDAGPAFRRHAARHPALDRFGAFEKFCFLRWPVLADLFPGEALLHVDGDVVFNDRLAVLAGHFAGRSLVLQGCPAVTAIADGEWLRCYCGELERFAADIDGYSAAAWEERRGWQDSERRRWAGRRDRPVISSDQDLLSHLIHCGRIPQADPAEFLAATPGHVYFENPLLIGELVADRPLAYRRDGAADFLGGRRVGIWHMQSDWCRYLVRRMFRERIGIAAASARLDRREGLPTRLALAALLRSPAAALVSRRAVYRRFFERGDFSAVFDPASWWEEAVFQRGD